ncbi:hypothetical protein C6P45_002642 [Maudiozyma exigua]|uniref:Uncharacterized protein n=1 Tax=Maudiozyma exigua TaxID=34358 RepID=A0A9P7B3J9_MAUEX|nr:hypothetical protein C6P45_002642 [Kazachstania exigua]
MSDIFERAVQDPCSIDIDVDDADTISKKSLSPPNHELRKVKTAPHFNTHHHKRTPSHTELRRTMTYIRPTRADSSLFVQQESRRPSFMLSQNDSKDKNSCKVIPTHIYGSEKYISSQLDELSTDDAAKYEDDDEEDDDSNTTDSSVFESKDATLSLGTPPMKRRSSSIKFSLANSFSSN